MEKYKIDCLVIGGGVSGLAIARKLTNSYEDIFLVEQNNQVGMETSSHNSEVIHAGIYYPQNSLKAKLCVKGKNLLYEYLEERNINYQRCGKFILATSSSETEDLLKIKNNAEECGVKDLEFNNSSINQYSFLRFQDSLFSPSTGIFDSHGYMQSLKNDFEGNGGSILLGNKCLKIEANSESFEVLIMDIKSKEEFLVETKYIINCAGLEAASIANSLYEEEKFKLKLIKGEYYSYQGKEKLKHLIYPLPKANSLGVHATIDLGKGIKFGPSAYEVEEIDYSISDIEKANFYKSVKTYWPSIDIESLSPDYSGIRAIVDGPKDFILDVNNFDESVLISILGYVSPGLTASMALANHIEEKLQSV
jgi:L-2-hydroxyglutarate oxidase LhgO